MKSVLLCCFLMMRWAQVSAQSQVVSVGDVKTVAVTNNQLNIATTHAFVQIQVYAPSVIRVRLSQQPFFR